MNNIRMFRVAAQRQTLMVPSAVETVRFVGFCSDGLSLFDRGDGEESRIGAEHRSGLRPLSAETIDGEISRLTGEIHRIMRMAESIKGVVAELEALKCAEE